MSIEFLGTGTSQGVPVIGCKCHVCLSADLRDQRLRTSALVRVKNAHLLIDTGPDLRQQMLRSKVDRLDAVLLTHEHMDHLAGMDDLRSFNFSQRRAMDIYADERTVTAVKRVFSYAFTDQRYPGVPELNMHTIGTDPFHIGHVQIIPIEVLHYKLPILGFRIDGLGYITDAKSVAPRELEKLQGVDVLVLNALRQESHISHFNLAEAIELIQLVRPRKAYLIHISHLMGSHEEVSRTLPPDIELAYDGLIVEVRSS